MLPEGVVLEEDFEDLKEKAKIADFIIFCNPHNPVGRVWTKEELETLLNEVYWDGYRANSAWTWTTLSYPTYTATNLKTNPIAITIGDKT